MDISGELLKDIRGFLSYVRVKYRMQVSPEAEETLVECVAVLLTAAVKRKEGQE